jgi:outer membrane protein OmpA-like peptidoglycan-associated protein
MIRLSTLIVAGSVLALSACADDPNRDAYRGAAVGAIAGGLLGHAVGNENGKYVGAAVGAMAGAGVGVYMDKQRKDLERQLAAETARKELQITQLKDGSLKVGVASDASFDIGSAQLKPQALNTFYKVAGILSTYDQTVIHVVGHTDSTGSDDLNQSLSERRAASVASYLSEQGVPANRLRQEGRGKHEPIASNKTTDGQRQNRRVDIVIKPVVQGREQEAWAPPPYLGT